MAKSPSAGRSSWRDAPATILAAIGLVSGFFGLTPALAQSGGACLADPNTAAAGDLGYRPRGSRCEGALQRYVSSRASVVLVGYHRGGIDFGTIRRASMLPLLVLADGGAAAPLALRVQSLTSQSRYQMDSAEVVPGQAFEWPVDLVKRAASNSQAVVAELDTLAVVACNARCSNRPDTVYWPVALANAPAEAASAGLSLKLLAGVRSDSVNVSLRPLTGGGPVRSWPVKGLALTPNGVATLTLPADLESGRYEITVEARDAQTREPLGALYATIVVPRAAP